MKPDQRPLRSFIAAWVHPARCAIPVRALISACRHENKDATSQKCFAHVCDSGCLARQFRPGCPEHAPHSPIYSPVETLCLATQTPYPGDGCFRHRCAYTANCPRKILASKWGLPPMDRKHLEWACASAHHRGSENDLEISGGAQRGRNELGKCWICDQFACRLRTMRFQTA
jgi:hypothetical protein